jgi:hypothetical protein
MNLGFSVVFIATQSGIAQTADDRVAIYLPGKSYISILLSSQLFSFAPAMEK